VVVGVNKFRKIVEGGKEYVKIVDNNSLDLKNRVRFAHLESNV